ncbi:MAG: hypothetical protein AB7F66_00810 [Bacteriovoracia bacterium]
MHKLAVSAFLVVVSLVTVSLQASESSPPPPSPGIGDCIYDPDLVQQAIDNAFIRLLDCVHVCDDYSTPGGNINLECRGRCYQRHDEAIEIFVWAKANCVAVPGSGHLYPISPVPQN